MSWFRVSFDCSPCGRGFVFGRNELEICAVYPIMAVGNGGGVEIASMGYEAAFGNRPVRQSGPAPGFGMLVEHEHAVPPRACEDAVSMHGEKTQLRLIG